MRHDSLPADDGKALVAAKCTSLLQRLQLVDFWNNSVIGPAFAAIVCASILDMQCSGGLDATAPPKKQRRIGEAFERIFRPCFLLAAANHASVLLTRGAPAARGRPNRSPKSFRQIWHFFAHHVWTPYNSPLCCL